MQGTLNELSKRAFTIPHFVDPDTCDQWLAWSEAHGYEAAGFGQNKGRLAAVRNNDRILEDNPERAALLWRLLEPSLPAYIRSNNAMQRGAIGLHHACGLNTRLRWYRYHPGQRFKMHADGAFRADSGELSMWTVLLYLNAVDEGGETRVVLGKKSNSVLVTPEAGLLLCFDHLLMHEGIEVQRGVKYVLRTDIMFRRAESS